MLAPNRIVALATPLLAPLAGAFAAWFTQALPGTGLTADMVEETFLAVTGLVLVLAFQFNHNRFKWDVLGEEVAAPAPAPALEEPLDVDDEFDDDDEDLLDDELFDPEGELLEGDAQLEAQDEAADVAGIR